MDGYGDGVKGDMRLVQPVLYAFHVVELPILEPVPSDCGKHVVLVSIVALSNIQGYRFRFENMVEL